MLERRLAAVEARHRGKQEAAREVREWTVYWGMRGRSSYREAPPAPPTSTVNQDRQMSTLELRYDWDYSDYARLPDDGNRYEVIDGELLVTPSPSPQHQRMSFRLAMLLEAFVSRHALGLVLYDVDLLFQTGQFLRPDILVVPESSRPGITRRGIEMPPSLVIEILSPTSAAIDKVKKPTRYGDFGIPEYWVLDAEERCAWVWRFAAGATEAERVEGRLTWKPTGTSEALVIDLAEVMKPL
jgi:Uma2 family endonuclease